jgi:hypothetical protein
MRSVIIVALKKQYVSHTLSVFVALVIQHAKHIFLVLNYVTFLISLYFSTLSHKRHTFLGKDIVENTMCFDFVY